MWPRQQILQESHLSAIISIDYVLQSRNISVVTYFTKYPNLYFYVNEFAFKINNV